MSYFLHKHLTKKQKKTVVDRAMFVAALAFPMTALPQIYQLYHTHNATGISLSSWVGFICFGFVFLAYGIVHKLKPYIMTQILWLAMDTLMVAGILLYR